MTSFRILEPLLTLWRKNQGQDLFTFNYKATDPQVAQNPFMANGYVSGGEPAPQSFPAFPFLSPSLTGGQLTSLSRHPDELLRNVSPQKYTERSSQIPSKETQAAPGESDFTGRRKRPAKMRRQTQMSDKARIILQFWLQLDPFPNRQEKQALATLCKLTYERVHNWFNNNRRRQKPESPEYSWDQQTSSFTSLSEADSGYQSLMSTALHATTPSRLVTGSTHAAVDRLSPEDTKRKPYQCTFGCDNRFSTRSDFRRHEETHCPQNEWICCYKLPPVLGEEGIKCVFCDEMNPTANHINREHNCQSCLEKRPTFRRKDKFREHLFLKHSQPFITPNMESWCRPIASKFNKSCGFCGHRFRTWLERIDHVADHFLKGWNMSQWQEPWVGLPGPGTDKDRDDEGGDYGYGGGSPGSDSEDGSKDSPGDSSGNSPPDEPQSRSWNSEGRQRGPGPGDQLLGEGKSYHDMPSLQHNQSVSNPRLTHRQNVRSGQTRDCAARHRGHNFEELSLVPGRSLNRGGFGVVKEVISREARFARKTIPWKRRSNLLDIALNEAEVLQHLRHRHIIQFAGSSYSPGNFNIFLNPVADCDLRQFMDEYSVSRDTGPDTLKKWTRCLSHAVKYMHKKGVRHFDLKPQNILTIGDHITIADFGLASLKDIPADDTAPMTPMYCAPEIYNRKLSGKPADIFSLGCVFLEMATLLSGMTLEGFHSFLFRDGHRPYHKNLQRMLEWVNLLTDRAKGSGELDAVSQLNLLNTITAMTDSDPKERPTAADLVSRLSPLGFCSCSIGGTYDQQGLDREAKSAHTHSGYQLKDMKNAIFAKLNPWTDRNISLDTTRTIAAIISSKASGLFIFTPLSIRDPRTEYRPVEKGTAVKTNTLTALQAAARRGDKITVQLLLERHDNAHTNDRGGKMKDCRGLTQSRWATRVMRLLLEGGTGKVSRDSHGQASLYRAAENSHLQVTERLRDKIPYRAVFGTGAAVSCTVADFCHLQATGRLLERATDTGFGGGGGRAVPHRVVLNMAVKGGANGRTSSSTAALHTAVETSSEVLTTASIRDIEAVLKLLLEESVDINTADKSSPPANVPSPISALQGNPKGYYATLTHYSFRDFLQDSPPVVAREETEVAASESTQITKGDGNGKTGPPRCTVM
ncbi:hypothetical protein GP486_005032 [Trichoglossum hirsutum]|uniref:Protein kinase domain-containing protein n=1 Tax=Trichoglossum hirsutum TaxID=265104 RepID=A0A9P8L9Y9_9PEZI|nr:hypothetical protein GP486_005032 [Trichoglossum hirsutum]